MTLRTICLAASLLTLAPFLDAADSVHLTYHWHLHQPIYWPERSPSVERYQFVWDSLQLKLGNTGNFYPGSTYKHPRNALVNGDGGELDAVFDKADRVTAYQSGGRNSINRLRGHPDAGASISYSGSLQENIWSLGSHNAYGYGTGWNAGYTEARGWLTSGGKPRGDLLGMTYHHSFGPLLPKSVLRKEIQIFKEIWWKSWNGNPNKSDHPKGYWPIECAFSETMIPVLAAEGYQWSIVANSHLARTCQNYLQVAPKGDGGWKIDPPNPADLLGPTVPANQWFSGTRDARGGCFPAPFAYQPHKVKYVDPETGVETKLTIVPMCDYLSYENGYASMGTGVIDAEIAPFNDPQRPSLVLLAHDGDNAWGGGSSYYDQSVPDLMNEAAGKGYRPTTIEQYLADHPVPESDVVHIEDGAWVNAADDWGHPQFINWLYPPTRSVANGYIDSDPRTYFDLETPGWTEDWRNWAVIIAATNYCETAEQITIAQGGQVLAWKIQEPVQKNGTTNNPNAAELAWHYFLGGLDSGFMYYGTSLDDEVKQTLAGNRAISHARPIIDANPTLDQTPPTVLKPQRWPWNPGGKGFGPLTHGRDVGFNGKPPYYSDFHVWTHAFDVSGIVSITLKVRADLDGVNPLSGNENETYAGGAGVNAWVSLPMNLRTVPKTNVTNNPQISFFLEPSFMANYYWAKVTGYRNQLVDYYIEAVDTAGNRYKSDIQHVFVGDDGSAPPTPPAAPANVQAAGASSSSIAVSWTASAGATSYRIKRDGNEVGSTSATAFTDTGLTPLTTYSYRVIAVNSAGSSPESDPASAMTSAVPTIPNAPTGLTATPISTSRIDLMWTASAGATSYMIFRDNAQAGTATGTTFSDTGLGTATTHAYQVIARNAAGDSPPSASVQATTMWAPIPFVLDGAADFAGYLVANPGMTIFAALRGTTLYVATWSPGSNGSAVSDHHIAVTDQLLAAATQATWWSKAGFTAVPSGKPLLGGESTNTYVGWSNAGPAARSAKAPTNSGQMEGSFDLVEAFGAVPQRVFIAATAYQTANGGALVAQAPAGNGDGNLDPNEFVELPIAALLDRDANGLFDRLDPQFDFLAQLCPDGTAVLLTWACVPGKKYQVEFTDSLGALWQPLTTVQTAPGGAATMSFQDTAAGGPSSRFYRVKLVP